MFSTHVTTQLEKYLPALPMIAVERDLYADIGDLVGSLLPGARLGLVDDSLTHEAWGRRVGKALGIARADWLTFPLPLDADDQAVEQARAQMAMCDALVAVGSGTISDIVKYAAYLDQKPYIIFPTAASMNGYLSANASIRIKGYKKTVTARMPVGVLCDLKTLCSGPNRLSVSGLADFLARSTAQADWLLSHLLLDTPYSDVPFSLLSEIEPMLCDHARGVSLQDRESIALLMQALLLSGIGMTIAGGSYPASQAEHMIAHTVGMLQDSKTKTLHGEEIGVTGLFMAHMQERFLHVAPTLRNDAFPEDFMIRLFGDYAASEAKKAYAIKQEKVKPLNPDNWPLIAEAIEKIHRPPARLQSVLEAAGAKTTPDALGWNQELFHTAISYARFLRDRFTFLDME